MESGRMPGRRGRVRGGSSPPPRAGLPRRGRVACPRLVSAPALRRACSSRRYPRVVLKSPAAKTHKKAAFQPLHSCRFGHPMLQSRNESSFELQTGTLKLLLASAQASRGLARKEVTTYERQPGPTVSMVRAMAGHITVPDPGGRRSALRLKDRTRLSAADVVDRAIISYAFIDAQLRDDQEVLLRDNEQARPGLSTSVSPGRAAARAPGPALPSPGRGQAVTSQDRNEPAPAADQGRKRGHE